MQGREKGAGLRVSSSGVVCAPFWQAERWRHRAAHILAGQQAGALPEHAKATTKPPRSPRPPSWRTVVDKEGPASLLRGLTLGLPSQHRPGGVQRRHGALAHQGALANGVEGDAVAHSKRPRGVLQAAGGDATDLLATPLSGGLGEGWAGLQGSELEGQAPVPIGGRGGGRR